MRHRTVRILMATALLLGMAAAAITPARAAEDEVVRYRQRLEKLFRQLDLNGDGRLDRLEVRANAYLQRHFDRLDRGGKGYLLPDDLSQ